MKLFTQHPQEQGISYLVHLRFATGIAARLLKTVIAFVLHAIFPFIGIKQEWDLEFTASFLKERNAWIEGAKQQEHPPHEQAGAGKGLRTSPALY